MTANPTRLCKGCGEVKDFVRGTWFWCQRNGATGHFCKQCHIKKSLVYAAAKQAARVPKQVATERTCKTCGESKPFAQGSWVWTAKYGACGNYCLACNSKKSSDNEMARRAIDPEFKAKRNEAMRVRQNAQYQNDADWRAKARARVSSASKVWKVTNRHLVNAAYKKRYAAKKRRTPSWLTADDFWMMEQAYELAQLRNKATGLEWHVDHIVPLQGANVSGLHVPANLQVILAAENLSKGAKWAIA